MTWSAIGTDLTVDEIAYVATAGELNDEAAEQLDHARHVAESLVYSGVVGDPERHHFNVTLSGHANPEHQQVSNGGLDMVSVAISQAPG